MTLIALRATVGTVRLIGKSMMDPVFPNRPVNHDLRRVYSFQSQRL